MGIPEGSLELHSRWKRGPRNLITDVPGVKVGQVTIQHGEVNTGVTAVLTFINFLLFKICIYRI